jgi:hypothetical protein
MKCCQYRGGVEFNYYELHLLLIQWIRLGEAHRISKVTAKLDSLMSLELEEHVKSLTLIDMNLW